VSEDGIPEGAVSGAEVEALAVLFDQYENAFDPLSPEAKEAESQFEDRVMALYQERVVPTYQSVTFAGFRCKLRSLCRAYLRKSAP
jgi:hypothetical protein